MIIDDKTSTVAKSGEERMFSQANEIAASMYCVGVYFHCIANSNVELRKKDLLNSKIRIVNAVTEEPPEMIHGKRK